MDKQTLHRLTQQLTDDDLEDALDEEAQLDNRKLRKLRGKKTSYRPNVPSDGEK